MRLKGAALLPAYDSPLWLIRELWATTITTLSSDLALERTAVTRWLRRGVSVFRLDVVIYPFSESSSLSDLCGPPLATYR